MTERLKDNECLRCMQLEARITELRNELMVSQIAARLASMEHEEQEESLPKTVAGSKKFRAATNKGM